MTIYTVRPSDTQISVANRFGVPLSRLRSDNNLAADAPLLVGEDLAIITPEEVYTVKPGDTLYRIAQNTGQSLNELLRKNPALQGVPLIYPGQVITLQTDGVPGREIIVNGYAYPYIEEEVLRRVLPYLTYLTVFTYGFTLEGTLIPADDERILEIAKSYDVAPLLLLSTLGPDGKFNNQLSLALFEDTQLQDTLIAELLRVMEEKGYEGLEVDFEFLGAEGAAGYVAFLERLKEALSAAGYPLFVALAPKTSADQPGQLYEGHDYAGIGNVADYVILMTYEWGYQFGPPGAVAPVKNVEEVVQYAVSEIPPEKILLGIPNYGYDWRLPFVRGETEAKGISMEIARETAAQNGAEILFDEEAQTPYYFYTLDGVEHVVWFENARSIAAKLALVEEYNLAGISIWQVMRYFPQLYRVLSETYGQASPPSA